MNCKYISFFPSFRSYRIWTSPWNQKYRSYRLWQMNRWNSWFDFPAFQYLFCHKCKCRSVGFKQALLKHLNGVRLPDWAGIWFPAVLRAAGSPNSSPSFTSKLLYLDIQATEAFCLVGVDFQACRVQDTSQEWAQLSVKMQACIFIQFAYKIHKHPPQKIPKAHSSLCITTEMFLEPNKMLSLCCCYYRSGNEVFN